jgi:siroheme synthase-like protein
MQLFPFFQDISGKRFVIIGSGNVAHEKAERLRQFTDNIEIVPFVKTEEDQTAGHTFQSAPPAENVSDVLSRADYCICAANDRELNRIIAERCADLGIRVNVADDPELCTFIFPALVQKGDLVIGISTQGTSPSFAGSLRRKIEAELPDNIEEILDRMGRLRSILPDIVPDQNNRKTIYGIVLSTLINCRQPMTDAEFEKIVSDILRQEQYER